MMDYEKKCTACGEGFPKLHACEIAGTIMERHECSNVLCGRRTATYTRDSGKSRKEWCWLQAMCDEVAAGCVTEIAAAVPDGEVANGYHAPEQGTPLLALEGKVIASHDYLSRRIILQPIEPAPLTGKAWAAKQKRFTRFVYEDVEYIILGDDYDRGYRHIVPTVSHNFPPIIRDYKCEWSGWPVEFDELCDAHIIHRPKGGE